LHADWPTPLPPIAWPPKLIQDASWIQLFRSVCHPPFQLAIQALSSAPLFLILLQGRIILSAWLLVWSHRLVAFAFIPFPFSFPFHYLFVILRIFSQSFCNVQFAPWTSYEQKNTGQCTDRNSRELLFDF
jgi:hypothetical protein